MAKQEISEKRERERDTLEKESKRKELEFHLEDRAGNHFSFLVRCSNPP